MFIALFLLINTLCIAPIHATSWDSSGNYVKYNVYSFERYYNINTSSPVSEKFKNVTYWALISATIVEANDTHISLNIVVLDTNDTTGTMFKKGNGKIVTLRRNLSVREALSLYIDPSSLGSSDGTYFNETTGYSRYGPYHMRMGLMADPTTGFVRGFVGKYVLNASSSVLGRNGYFIYENIMAYKLIETNIDGLKTLSDSEYNELYSKVAISTEPLVGNSSGSEEDNVQSISGNSESNINALQYIRENILYVIVVAVIAVAVVVFIVYRKR